MSASHFEQFRGRIVGILEGPAGQTTLSYYLIAGRSADGQRLKVLPVDPVRSEPVWTAARIIKVEAFMVSRRGVIEPALTPGKPNPPWHEYGNAMRAMSRAYERSPSTRKLIRVTAGMLLPEPQPEPQPEPHMAIRPRRRWQNANPWPNDWAAVHARSVPQYAVFVDPSSLHVSTPHRLFWVADGSNVNAVKVLNRVATGWRRWMRDVNVERVGWRWLDGERVDFLPWDARHLGKGPHALPKRIDAEIERVLTQPCVGVSASDYQGLHRRIAALSDPTTPEQTSFSIVVGRHLRGDALTLVPIDGADKMPKWGDAHLMRTEKFLQMQRGVSDVALPASGDRADWQTFVDMMEEMEERADAQRSFADSLTSTGLAL
jgi:hypothetical protein